MHELLADSWVTLDAVEHLLVDVLTAASPSASGARGPLWCAAEALDVTASVWHRLQPSAGRRFGWLGAQLQRSVDRGAAVQPSAALSAASIRTASQALERLAAPAGNVQAPLEMLERATVTLAAMSVQLWSALHGPARCAGRGGRPAIDRRLAIRRNAALIAAAVELHAGSVERVSVGEWLARAVAQRPPTDCLTATDDSSADRVLAAEATWALRGAWMTRGALELQALRCLARESRASPPPRTSNVGHTVAATHVAIGPARAMGRSNARTWRAHSLALTRTAATYLRACEGSSGWREQVRTELVDVLADSLVQASGLDTHHRR